MAKKTLDYKSIIKNGLSEIKTETASLTIIRKALSASFFASGHRYPSGQERIFLVGLAEKAGVIQKTTEVVIGEWQQGTEVYLIKLENINKIQPEENSPKTENKKETKTFEFDLITDQDLSGFNVVPIEGATFEGLGVAYHVTLQNQEGASKFFKEVLPKIKKDLISLDNQESVNSLLFRFMNTL